MTQNGKRVLLPVKRFKQYPSECGIAATASLANYYDSSVKYEDIRKLIPSRKRNKGTFSSQQGRMLNELGFSNVNIVTADLDLVDFSWRELSKRGLINKLRKVRAHHSRAGDQEGKRYANDMVKWLEDEECDNRLIIDDDFPKYIKRCLDADRPIGVSLNWTALFKLAKSAGKKNGDITGQEEDHSVILRGYDDKGVFIVDSHHQWYRGKRKKYKNGFYKINWATLLINIPQGDLIWVN